MAEEKKKPTAGRYTLAPIYLAAGLAVCYLVLTRMVPAMQAAATDRPNELATHGWPAVTMELSSWVCRHRVTTLTAFAILSLAGFALPLLVRPARYLVWLAALAVFLFDVAAAGGGYWQMLTTLLLEANKVSG